MPFIICQKKRMLKHWYNALPMIPIFKSKYVQHKFCIGKLEAEDNHSKREV